MSANDRTLSKRNHCTIATILKVSEPPKYDIRKTIKLLNQNSFQLRKNKNLREMLIDEKRTASVYQSINADDVEYCQKQKVDHSSSHCSSNKQLMKLRRYKSIQHDGIQKQRSAQALRYLPKKGRILLNIVNSSRPNHKNIIESQEPKKSISMSVGLKSLFQQNQKPYYVNKRQNKQQGARKVELEEQLLNRSKQPKTKKCKSRRFLTQISTNQDKYSEGLTNKDPIGKEKKQNIKKERVKTQALSEFNQYLDFLNSRSTCQTKNSHPLRPGMQKKKKKLQEGAQRNNKENRNDAEELGKFLADVSSIMQQDQSSFFSESCKKGLADQLFTEHKIIEEADQLSQNDENLCEESSVEVSFKKGQERSKKNILRSIQKIKRAFPKGFFQGI